VSASWFSFSGRSLRLRLCVGSVRVFRNFQCVSAAAQEADDASRIAALSGSKPNSERYAWENGRG
jgi:hypothetical protein